MKFCSACSAPVELKIPTGDSRERFVCPACDQIFYHNPLVVTGCVAQWQNQILLCKRAIEPRRGFWTVPAGFMENGETVAEGAARETWEEALAKVETTSLLAIVDVVHAKQVHIFYRANLISDEYGVGEESLETVLVDESEIPWNDIAFPSVKFALNRYLSDRTQNLEAVHSKIINPKIVHPNPLNESSSNAIE